MKLYVTRFFIALMALMLCSCTDLKVKNGTAVSYPKALTQLHENVLNYYLQQKIQPQTVNHLLSTLKEDGSWKTIDYTTKIKSEWPVKNHLKYLQILAISYTSKSSKLYKDKTLSKKIHKSLDYWLDHDFLSANWHDQHIGVPKFLLPTLLLMESELTKTQLDKGIVLANRAKIKMSGQNKVWLATNVLLKSLLLRDAETVAKASKAIQEELKVAKNVGIKSDWSYHEHGAQLQFGNYGLWYLENMIQCYAFVNDTPFQFEKHKIAVLRNYVLEGQQWIHWNNSYDVNALGRHLYKDEQQKKAARLKVCLEQMKQLDKAYSEEYDKALDTKMLSGNKHFWKSDFHVHRRNDFYFSVKMSSQRVVGTESVNSENIQGYYMGDGLALLSVNNQAYQNVFPFWDWKKLPGTTIAQDTAKLPIIKFRDFKTNGVFVGGVSNGENGIAVMDYDRDGVKAKKSWFMFNDFIVCLGTDISSDKSAETTTAINQSFLEGNVVISKAGNIQQKINQQKNVALDWVLHDSIGYLFPKNQNTNIATNILVGSWNKVAKRYRPVLLTEHIFKLWVSHGTRPTNAAYAYILVPNTSEEKMMNLHENHPFKIVNTAVFQSVESVDQTLAGMVFYKKGNSKLKGGLAVDHPCVLLLEEKADHLQLAISDPAQTLKTVTITLQGNYKTANSTYHNGKTQLNVALPQGEYAGESVVLALERNK
jgi:chondroitin AC lyase